MTLEQLRCFCKVIETGSFRAAAEQLHRSQPAVSLQVKALERACGQILLQRKSGAPTPAGRRLYNRAIHILSLVESARNELKIFDATAAQTLKAGAGDTTALYILPKVICSFARSLPHVRVTLVNRPTDVLVDLVVKGILDLALVTLPVFHPELEQRKLFTEEIIAVAPSKHALSRRRNLSLHDLAQEPILLLDPSTRTGMILTQHFQQNSFHPLVTLESGSFEVLKRYVAAGLGIAFLPRIALTPADKKIARLSVRGLPSVELGTIWRHGTYQTRAQKTFLEMVLRYANSLKKK